MDWEVIEALLGKTGKWARKSGPINIKKLNRGKFFFWVF